MDDIDELARKAVEAEKAYRANPATETAESSILSDRRFKAKITPAAWLERSERITELEAALKEAREALKPFAMQVENVHEKDENEWSIVDPQWQHPSAVFLTIGDLRRAARALSPAMKERR